MIDRGQACVYCGLHFKYQELYDEHVPCRWEGWPSQPNIIRWKSNGIAHAAMAWQIVLWHSSDIIDIVW